MSNNASRQLKSVQEGLFRTKVLSKLFGEGKSEAKMTFAFNSFAQPKLEELIADLRLSETINPCSTRIPSYK